MATIERIVRPARASRETWRRFARYLGAWMPKGLYARSLIIIVAPIVILQAVVAFVFMERHWQQVTARLSESVTQNIAGIIDLHETYSGEADRQALSDVARRRYRAPGRLLPPDPLPPAVPKPFFSLLDRTLSEEITRQIGRPFWIDTVGRSNLVEIRIRLDDAVLRVFARRSQAYASNSHIFIVWMVVASLILLAVAISFLRNQIRPILQLADAAEEFGKGRDTGEFRPRGAREVRRAAQAFIEMRRASSARSNSARPCSPGSATICEPSSPASSWNLNCLATRPTCRRCAAMSTRCSTCLRTTCPSRAEIPARCPNRWT
jgi:two-component system, OmpR family, osmolarity sensor histidine kinase EnvZ